MLVPLIPPVLLVLMTARRGGWVIAFGDWPGIVFLGIFGFAAMIALGTPLLFCYLRLGWTGFVPFMAGGGICAGITSYAVLHRGPNTAIGVEYFIIPGIVAGAFFRMILFGFQENAALH